MKKWYKPQQKIIWEYGFPFYLQTMYNVRMLFKHRHTIKPAVFSANQSYHIFKTNYMLI